MRQLLIMIESRFGMINFTIVSKNILIILGFQKKVDSSYLLNCAKETLILNLKWIIITHNINQSIKLQKQVQKQKKIHKNLLRYILASFIVETNLLPRLTNAS